MKKPQKVIRLELDAVHVAALKNLAFILEQAQREQNRPLLGKDSTPPETGQLQLDLNSPEGETED